MEILELLPFIGLLLLQFIYQIYKAYKKKNSPMGESPSPKEVESNYSSPLESMEEGIGSKPRESDESYFQAQPTEDEFYNINSPAAKDQFSSSGSTFSIIDEIFGEQFPASVERSTSKPSSIKSRENISSEDQLEREYNEVEVASRRYKRSPTIPPINTVPQKANNSKTTPALELLKKMRSKKNLKDYWKVKFILDQPVGMEITPLGRTNQISFQPHKQVDTKPKHPNL